MADGPIVIYPRAFVTLKVLLRQHAGEEQKEVFTSLTPDEASITFRPHHQANTAEVTILLSALPFDPREVEGIFLCVYMGAVRRVTDSVHEPRFLRFCGYADKVKQKRERKGPSVMIEARDLSSVLRDLKPLPVSATPKYSDTVTQALRRILSAAGLTDDQLEISDPTGLGTFQLSKLVAQRAASGYLPLKRDITYWEAVEHVAGVASLLVHVELGQMILRKPADAFALTTDQKAPPRYTFTFGDAKSTVMSIELSKKFLRNRKGVKVVAFDPVARRVVEAVYPPDGQLPPKKRPKLGPAKKHKARTTTTGSVVKDPDRDVFAVGDLGVHSQDALNDIAERIWRERSRQEMEGQLETVIWDNSEFNGLRDENGKPIDIFDLRNGHRIEASINPDLSAELRNTSDRNRAVAFLRARLNLTEETARALVDHLKAGEGEVYYTRQLTHRWSIKRASTEIEFITLIEV